MGGKPAIEAPALMNLMQNRALRWIEGGLPRTKIDQGG